MSLGVEKLLPSDCLNINEIRVIHTNTHSDAHEYLLEQRLLPFHNLDGEYQFAIEFACLAYIYLPEKASVNEHFNCMGKIIHLEDTLHAGEVAQFLQYKAGDQRVASSRKSSPHD